MEHLTSMIYHEKQQSGSMLCAQHALNSLLQGNYFTAPDLAQIARGLDALEENYDHANTGNASTNMDDSGFFSVQVLENALHVWGLTLVRWRSEDMRPYQDHPHTQLAFILNFQQHWFTLRRFGAAFPDPTQDPGNGHWFNLNSFLRVPERVSQLYLGLVLQQAEQEGYSVFAVIQQDPSAPLCLPRTPADDVASTIPESSFSATATSHLSTAREPPVAPEGFEDEDMELQAALQASLTAGSSSSDAALPQIPPQRSGTSSGTRTPRGPPDPSFPPPHRATDEEDDAGGDPVAASLARNRAMLARMRHEQEMALRAGYEEEAARVDVLAGHRARSRQEQGEGEEEEEEMLRRAIRESQAQAEAEGHSQAHEEKDEEIDIEDGDYKPPIGTNPPATSSSSHRVYDDDDAELQAALRASLEHVAPGFVLPPSSVTSSRPPPVRELEEGSEVGSEAETDIPSSDPPEAAPNVDVDEMRKRRLARFGG